MSVIHDSPGSAPSRQAAPAAPSLYQSEQSEVSQPRGKSSILDLQVPPPPVLPYTPLWVAEEVQLTALESLVDLFSPVSLSLSFPALKRRWWPNNPTQVS